MTAAGAHIYDRGYRSYDGERRGVGWAMLSLGIHAVQRVLGIKRQARTKVIPALTILLAYLPAIVFIGMAAFLSEDLLDADEPILPTYGEYYGFITFAILLFVAIVAPEVLCTDRRTGMLELYLASPLDRDTYLASKAGAVFAVLGAVTLGPPLLLLVALSLEGAGPDGLVGFLTVLGRVLAAGVGVAVLHGTLSLAVSSTTKRRAFASTAIVLILLLSGAVASGLTEGAGAPAGLAVLNLIGLPAELALRIHGEVDDEASETALSQLGTGWVVVANVGWSVLFAVFARQRYQRIRLER